MNKKSAIFLDKDGTLIENVHYNVDTSLIKVFQDAAYALKIFQRLGYKIIIVSNQSGVARGYFNVSSLEPVFQTIKNILSESDIEIDGFYYCPHHPNGMVKEYSIICSCRKPSPGMLHTASKDLDIDLSSSWMIGDILSDVETGKRAGCRTILVDHQKKVISKYKSEETPDFIVSTLAEAANLIRREHEM